MDDGSIRVPNELPTLGKPFREMCKVLLGLKVRFRLKIITVEMDRLSYTHTRSVPLDGR